MSGKIVTIRGAATELELTRKGNVVRHGDQSLEVIAVRGHEAEVRIGDRTVIVPFAIDGSAVSFALDGEIVVAEVVDKGQAVRARHRDHSMSAPMPGVVTKIAVQAGDVVAKGATLLILEAMKMEHQVLAPYAGTVTSVNCREGEMVQPGVDLVDVEQAEATEAKL
ncbi:MAG: biotin/lipoyl-containing protein [Thermoanaerobaculia bacterium]